MARQRKRTLHVNGKQVKRRNGRGGALGDPTGGGSRSPEETPMDDITIKLGEPPRVQDQLQLNGGNGGGGVLGGGPMPPPPPPDDSNPAIYGPVDSPMQGQGPSSGGSQSGGMAVASGAPSQAPRIKPIVRGRLFSDRKSQWIKMGGIDGIPK